MTVTASAGRPAVSQTYIDGKALTAGHGVTDRRPHTITNYTNNYMGSALPARRRLVTMDTLGRLVQKRLPRRPMSGVERSSAVTVQKNRVMSAPVTGNRTSGNGQL